jgi:ribonuclease-3
MKTAEAFLGHGFEDRALLERALTHGSAGPGAGPGRLEFLGDAVLELLAREYLMEEFPDGDEGMMTAAKASLVSERALARAAREAGLAVMTGPSVAEAPDSVLAGAVEALLGALYLEAGLDVARTAVRNALAGFLSRGAGADADPRGRLSAECSRRGLPEPAYGVARLGGADHAPSFGAEVTVDGVSMGSATGSSKREACAEAARQALRRLSKG